MLTEAVLPMLTEDDSGNSGARALQGVEFYDRPNSPVHGDRYGGV